MSDLSGPEVWSGQWVTDRLDLTVTGAARPGPVTVRDLVGLAVRRNPRRAHLLVSRVLGKHLPASPALVYGSGLLLGAMTATALGGEPTAAIAPLGAALRAALRPPGGRDAGSDGQDSDGDDGNGDQAATRLLALTRAVTRPNISPAPVVLGYAETATGLGHAVADALRAPYLHSTRRPVRGVTPVGAFEEEHSHATSHLLLPENRGLLAGPGALVLVDDELTTGTTVRNTITALHAAFPRDHYVVAALVDLRNPTDRARLTSLATELGVVIEVVALATGHLGLPCDAAARGIELVAAVEAAAAVGAAAVRIRRDDEPASAGGLARRVCLDWPTDLPDGARHGFSPGHRARLEGALPALGAALAGQLALPPGASVLVLGTEELMYAPLRLAEALAAQVGPGVRVRYSTTTRSPVHPVDDPAYAIRTRLEFSAHDNPADGPGPRYAYNVAPAAGDGRFDTVIVVVDQVGDTDALHSPLGLLARLATVTDDVALAVIPSYRPATTYAGGVALPSPLRGPAFGSYDRDEVGWLLTDLSGAALEAPTEEREEAIQAGGAHYAESLPVEYQPSPDYQRLFHESLEASAERVAHAVGVLTESALAARGEHAVLVSLARAGTPIGVLMRRWAQHTRGVDLAHYAVSIVRGRGIDPVALRYLATHHDPGEVMFVDGWTDKGAITRELAAALAVHAERTGERFNSQLAVLADPGRCVELFGTREDYLIPSACLNSTVSGLVSRTVLNDTHLAPGQFHGAKFYADLAAADVSNAFLDAVSARFADVAEAVRKEIDRRAGQVPEDPTWDGWRAVERISRDYGIGDVNLVKPGVGETTRVLLRRVPWKVLVSDTAGDLRHIRLLAAQRGVPVEAVSGLPYSCVGLIHPNFTRGATGADGIAVGAAATT